MVGASGIGEEGDLLLLSVVVWVAALSEVWWNEGAMLPRMAGEAHASLSSKREDAADVHVIANLQPGVICYKHLGSSIFLRYNKSYASWSYVW